MYEMFERDELGEILIPIIDDTSMDDEPIELSLYFGDEVKEEDGFDEIKRIMYLFAPAPEGEELEEINRIITQRELNETTEKLIGGKIIPTLVLNNINEDEKQEINFPIAKRNKKKQKKD